MEVANNWSLELAEPIQDIMDVLQLNSTFNTIEATPRVIRNFVDYCRQVNVRIVMDFDKNAIDIFMEEKDEDNESHFILRNLKLITNESLSDGIAILREDDLIVEVLTGV